MKPLLVTLVLATTMVSGGTATASSLGGVLYYPRADGVVAGIDVDTGVEVITVPSASFVGAVVGSGRETAFDPVMRLLWYSATDGFLHSVNVDSLVAGPDITTIPGGNVGTARHLFIDYARRKLMTPITDGSIQFYNLSDQQTSGSIPSNFFTDGNVGVFRHLGSDERSGTIWYAATDGSFREMDPDSLTDTRRVVPFSEQQGANPGAFRHMVVDPARNLLLYAVTDGSVASIDLAILQAAAFAIAVSAFDNAGPGAGRIITYDPPEISAALPSVSFYGLLALTAGILLTIGIRRRQPLRGV